MILEPDLEAYARRCSTPEAALLTEVAAATHELSDRAQMMVGHLEGSFLATLVALLQPSLVLEIGTFTGYSALAMAPELRPGARIVTCELDPRHASIARAHFGRSPHGERIELREGPALETIDALDGPFDLVFIDADKTGYDAYFEAVLPKLAPDGLIIVDNVLWRGLVLDPDATDPDTVALQALNRKLADDERIIATMLTVRDGMTLVRRRP